MNGPKDNVMLLPANGKPTGWTVKRLSIDELFNMEEEWQSLLRHSDADQLFLGPAWLSSWWDSWGKKQDNVEALILTVRNSSNELVGMATLGTELYSRTILKPTCPILARVLVYESTIGAKFWNLSLKSR